VIPLSVTDVLKRIGWGVYRPPIPEVELVTGFVEDGPMVRVVLKSGATIIGPMLPTLAALYRIGYHDSIKQKRPHLRLVGH